MGPHQDVSAKDARVHEATIAKLQTAAVLSTEVWAFLAYLSKGTDSQQITEVYSNGQYRAPRLLKVTVWTVISVYSKRA